MTMKPLSAVLHEIATVPTVETITQQQRPLTDRDSKMVATLFEQLKAVRLLPSKIPKREKLSNSDFRWQFQTVMDLRSRFPVQPQQHGFCDTVTEEGRKN